ncbi:DNA polymerase ligase N-terminal domain-containing protein [Acidisphaera sp. S103]|uniref:DNA polymerase ligase N-terminal domain-containing protein n=1 Tax=Acidisphaera sp. S103 TaxID=1747223 RepID=UPI00131C134B|nr:DNA polymerase ligase N-terminal domain-containing protein [Acidisphaera sp. S103]
MFWAPVSNLPIDAGVAASKKLSTYQVKRDFTQTEEPSGEALIVAINRRRFIIQEHAATGLHYDLRLELDGVFKSWAVTRGLSMDPADRRLAVGFCQRSCQQV